MRSKLAVRVQAVLLASLAIIGILIASEYTADTDRRFGGLNRDRDALPAVSAVVLQPVITLGSALPAIAVSTFIAVLLAWLTPLRHRQRFSPWVLVLSLIWCLLAVLVVAANANVFRYPCSTLSQRHTHTRFPAAGRVAFGPLVHFGHSPTRGPIVRAT